MVEKTRETKETQIKLKLNTYGKGISKIDTGVGFLDHMLESFSKHSLIDINLECEGDIHIDDHHSVEDSAIKGINRIKNRIIYDMAQVVYRVTSN